MIDSPNKIEILGVKINAVDLAGIWKLIEQWLDSSGHYYLVTINPEFVMAAQGDPIFKDNLNRASLAICDGVGLVWAARFLGRGRLWRVTGVDLVKKILREGGRPVYLLGGQPGVAEAVARRFPQGRIVGFNDGGRIDTSTYLLENNDKAINNINQSGAEILLVAFGQVKQENWIVNNLSNLPKVKLAIGVGGSFDYLSGQIRRAPKFFRIFGLEWLFRLAHEPRRLKRIYQATIKFSWLVIREKLK